MTVSDTIAAISTPPGEGAIALVRVSGANAIEVADKIFHGKEPPSEFEPRVQHLGEIFGPEDQLIDQVVLSVHHAPASYTGEDLIEISCHGGTLVSAKVPEAGVTPDEGETLRARLDLIREEIAALLATADQGRILREGVRVVIYGATNAGKSSLLNRLLGYDRVIVSDTHGTTRDTIEEMVNLNGVPIRLLDTAGLRTSTSELEREGIARTEKSLQLADLRLYIADRSTSKPSHFQERIRNPNEITVLNKSDLPENGDWKDFHALRISCLTGEGLPELQKEILTRITKQNLKPESMLAINARHRDCLRRALESCDRAATVQAQGLSPEYAAIHLHEALRAVGEVIGVVDVEQILDSVFSQFCIGK